MHKTEKKNKWTGESKLAGGWQRVIEGKEVILAIVSVIVLSSPCFPPDKLMNRKNDLGINYLHLPFMLSILFSLQQLLAGSDSCSSPKELRHGL